MGPLLHAQRSTLLQATGASLAGGAATAASVVVAANAAAALQQRGLQQRAEQLRNKFGRGSMDSCDSMGNLQNPWKIGPGISPIIHEKVLFYMKVLGGGFFWRFEARGGEKT